MAFHFKHAGTRLFFSILVLAAICTTLSLKSGPDQPLAVENLPSSPYQVTEPNDVGSHRHCHFHAGIEHCADERKHQETTEPFCGKTKHEYDVPLRLMFAIVVGLGSAIGVLAPLFLGSIHSSKRSNLAVIALKQCGTGVILSTAFVHLFTHANLMLANECIADYNLFEGTAATILMAGIFTSFLFEFVVNYTTHPTNGRDTVSDLGSKAEIRPSPKTDRQANILMLEAGIVFHSILIGITLVVAGDSYFITLAIVITFHQMFEGLALGTRIAALGHDKHTPRKTGEIDSDQAPLLPSHLSTTSLPCSVMRGKYLLATCFILVTPLGMLIGIALLGSFNGNDPTTILAIGTLDAFSAGILAWFGIVEMLANDWMSHGGGEMAGHNVASVAIGLVSLVVGMVMMTVLGRWA